jgi:hypothetical protein
VARRYHDVHNGSTLNENHAVWMERMVQLLGDLWRKRPLRTALIATFWALLIAMVAAAVRVLPWMLDPRVPWTVLAPFARSIALVGAEAALLLGGPIGWALSAAHSVETKEARVFALLGEPPWRTSLRGAPEILALAALLAIVSLAGGRDANAPGGVVTELVARGRDTCREVTSPSTQVVPFLSAEWLCAPGREPRLVANAPIGNALVTARDATVAGDFRRIDLADARFNVGNAQIHVGALTLRGLPPWARASALAPWLRALLMALSLVVASLASSLAISRIRLQIRFGAVAIGASGPLATLGALRYLERRDAAAIANCALPFAAFAAVVVTTLALGLWQTQRARRLLSLHVTATKSV